MDFCPRKYLIKDLVNREPPLDVWIQGAIENVNNNNNILIISDISGVKAKILFDPRIEKTMKNSNNTGTYCCILGVYEKTTEFVEIHAKKFANLSSNPITKQFWETEVKEANLFLEGKLIPKI